MRSMSISPQIQQALAVIAPVAALAIFLGVVYPTWGRYGELRKTVEQQRRELADLKSTPLPPRDPVLPAAKAERGESAQFLGQIVGLGVAAGCRFAGMDVVSAAAAPNGLLRSVRAKVEVEGRYPQVRRFLAQIAHAPRVFTIASVDLNSRVTAGPTGASETALHAIVEIERYIATNPPPGPAPQQVSQR